MKDYLKDIITIAEDGKSGFTNDHILVCETRDPMSMQDIEREFPTYNVLLKRNFVNEGGGGWEDCSTKFTDSLLNEAFKEAVGLAAREKLALYMGYGGGAYKIVFHPKGWKPNERYILDKKVTGSGLRQFLATELGCEFYEPELDQNTTEIVYKKETGKEPDTESYIELVAKYNVVFYHGEGSQPLEVDQRPVDSIVIVPCGENAIPEGLEKRIKEFADKG